MAIVQRMLILEQVKRGGSHRDAALQHLASAVESSARASASPHSRMPLTAAVSLSHARSLERGNSSLNREASFQAVLSQHTPSEGPCNDSRV